MWKSGRAGTESDQDEKADEFLIWNFGRLRAVSGSSGLFPAFLSSILGFKDSR
jgi:hypothetical protein